ncbi:MAG: hypothetical protein HY695_18805 [Deltaproteobacteria bacterium]|nr:hypothetical protein [Deltaproteobacteria bacterium]
MLLLGLCLLVATLMFSMPVFGQGGAPLKLGEWSKEANSLLVYAPEPRKIQFTAPDKKTVAVIDGTNLFVVRGGNKLSGIEDEGFLDPAELGWASDSKGFFVTWSDGGSVGWWQTFVYLVEKERVRRINVTKEVEREFKKHYKCTDSEDPNIGAIKWLKGSRNLLVVAEVPPHSTCPQMGLFMGYIVSVPSGKILEQFSQQRLKSVWGRYLGARLNPKAK